MKTAVRDCSASIRALLEQALRDDSELSPYFDPFDHDLIIDHLDIASPLDVRGRHRICS